jgi:hypothetical protein
LEQTVRVQLASAGITLLALSACGIVPEKVSRGDPRLRPMFDAMDRVDRKAMGFTPVAEDASIRVELPSTWALKEPYDAMLHIYGETSDTVAFRRAGSGYEWIGEQETFQGPQKYRTPDGELNEQIVINYDKVPTSGYPVNTLAI